MKLTAQAAGTYAIAPTPFHDDGRIDERSIDRLADFYAEVGCDGVTVLGILGEAPKLDAAEAEQVAIRFVKRAKNMQIIVGVSAPGFASMRSLAKASMDAGAAGGLFQAGAGSCWRRHSLGAAGLSADLVGRVHPTGDPQDRDG
jgi:4-hydroxy-tetrahydrodipicolinate synthase